MFVSPSESKPGLGRSKLKALGFDLLIFILLFLPGVPPFMMYLGRVRDYTAAQIQDLMDKDPTFYIVVYYWLGLVFLFLLRDGLKHQSPGKKRAGLMVVDQNNRSASPGKTILRNFLSLYTWPIDLACLNDERTLPDTLLGTKIVRHRA